MLPINMFLVNDYVRINVCSLDNVLWYLLTVIESISLLNEWWVLIKVGMGLINEVLILMVV